MVNAPITAFNHIAILGMGRSGQAVLAACLADGISITVYDDKGATRDTDAYFSSFENWEVQKLDALVISPGIAHLHPAPHPAAQRCIEAGVPIISEVEFALRRGRAGRWVSITGTNGKSTLVSMCEHIARSFNIKAVACGNNGYPVLDALKLNYDLYIIEISSFQLELVQSIKSKRATILNLSND